jgi:hypothetical protein
MLLLEREQLTGRAVGACAEIQEGASTALQQFCDVEDLTIALLVGEWYKKRLARKRCPGAFWVLQVKIRTICEL